MKITTMGIDLAKSVLQVHGVDERGKAVLRKQLKRKDVVSFFANLQPCLIGMEACGSAHYWARKLTELGHTVRLMAPQFVKPYVKTNKSDRNDAEAICEAVARPSMRFVPMKSPEQQALLGLHRARQGFVKARTAQANQIRGLLAEFGIIIPKGIEHIAKHLPEILEDGENGLPGMMRELFQRLGENLKAMDKQAAELERQIKLWHRESEQSLELEEQLAQVIDFRRACLEHFGRRRVVEESEQQVLDGDEFVPLLPRLHEGHVQADFEFLGDHQFSSITQHSGCWCWRAYAVTCSTLVAATSRGYTPQTPVPSR